jgi:hypothetical protein
MNMSNIQISKTLRKQFIDATLVQLQLRVLEPEAFQRGSHFIDALGIACDMLEQFSSVIICPASTI